MAWWTTSYKSTGGTTYPGERVSVFTAQQDVVHASWVWASLACTGVAIILLGLRLAARSWYHEPATWRRDMIVAGVLLVASAALVSQWPVDIPFWGSHTFAAENTTIAQETVGAGAPGLGWYTAILSGLLALAASRVTDEESNGDDGVVAP
jgi:hypothetical protein